MITIDEIEKTVWERMQKAIVQKDAQAVATLNGMAIEVAEIKERIRALAERVGGPRSLNGAQAQTSTVAPSTAGLGGVSTPSPHGIAGNYTGRPIRGYRLNGANVSVRTYKDLLISLSSGLRKKHGAKFDHYALQLGGRKRRYFSRSQQDMKYAHEFDVGFFVETNLNANLIVNNICLPLLEQLEPGADFEIQ